MDIRQLDLEQLLAFHMPKKEDENDFVQKKSSSITVGGSESFNFLPSVYGPT